MVALTAPMLLLAGCSAAGGVPAAATAPAPLVTGGSARASTTIEGFNDRPASLTVGETLVDRVRILPQTGQAVRVEVRSVDDPWRVTTLAPVNAVGRAVVRVSPPGVGEYRMRLLAAGTPTSGAARTAFRRVLVSGERRAAKARYVYATGDIGECGGQTAATAKLIPTGARVIAAGDLAYPSGSAASFASCYLPYYGKFKSRTFPVPGNHEYYAPDLAYFDVFGPRVGTRTKPWYTMKIGRWRFWMLNSNCSRIGGCGRGSRQYRWLNRQIAAHPAECTAAVWHTPRWSSGRHGSNRAVGQLYRRLVDAGGDLLLSGHDHSYERFARKRPSGRVAGSGMRQLVVGTGGAHLYQFSGRVRGSLVQDAGHHGVLRLRLGNRGYSWRFLSTDGAAVDKGSDSC